MGEDALDAIEYRSGPSRPRSSWREGKFANWTVVLGEKTYRLHRFILARASEFFEGCVADEYRNNKTDLTDLIPESCRAAFECVLDFIYDGKAEVTAENALEVLWIADILGIEEVFQTSLTVVKENRKSPSRLVPFLTKLSSARRNSVLPTAMESVWSALISEVKSQFDRVFRTQSPEFLKLSVDQLLEILQSDDLVVSSEDVVFDCVEAFISHSERPSIAHSDPSEVSQRLADLWGSVRPPRRSSGYLSKAMGVPQIDIKGAHWDQFTSKLSSSRVLQMVGV